MGADPIERLDWSIEDVVSSDVLGYAKQGLHLVAKLGPPVGDFVKQCLVAQAHLRQLSCGGARKVLQNQGVKETASDSCQNPGATLSGQFA